MGTYITLVNSQSRYQVVVAGNDRQTRVLVRSAESLVAGGFPASVQDPLLELQTRIVRAMETIGDREEAPLLVNS